MGTSAGSFVFPTELGWMSLAWTSNRLLRVSFGHPSAAAASASLALDCEAQTMTVDDLPAWISELAGRLQAYAGGEKADFSEVPLDLSHLTDFQRKIVRACRRICPGSVKSYGELAAAAGSPGAARAVGNVMAKNRFPIVVPCHRVVGSAGSLGGFSAPDGLSMKRRMLALEGYAGKKQRLNRPAARRRSRPSVAS